MEPREEEGPQIWVPDAEGLKVTDDLASQILKESTPGGLVSAKFKGNGDSWDFFT